MGGGILTYANSQRQVIPDNFCIRIYTTTNANAAFPMPGFIPYFPAFVTLIIAAGVP